MTPRTRLPSRAPRTAFGVRSFGPFLALLALFGCAESTPLDESSLYLESADFRARELEASLVNPDNGYSQLRLENYSSEWSELPEWNPPVRPLTTFDIGAFVDDPSALSEGLTPLFDRDSFELTHEGLMELGRRAFEGFPMGVDNLLGGMTHREGTVRAVGLWQDERAHLGGMVRLRVAGGDVEAFAPTCSTCHGRTLDGVLVHGAANVDFDYGVIQGTQAVPSRWGAGRLDVTPDGEDNPVTIGDLRPIRYQRRLHRAATVRNGFVALAIRIETLMITSYDQNLRPPREVPLALAYYLWNMADEPTPDASHPGAALYSETCSHCHGIGQPAREGVDLSDVSTDRRVGESRTRGTGQYRVPSLVMVSERPALLNRGEPISVRELLDDSSWPLGHSYGRDLSDRDKDLISDYLATW